MVALIFLATYDTQKKHHGCKSTGHVKLYKQVKTPKINSIFDKKKVAIRLSYLGVGGGQGGWRARGGTGDRGVEFKKPLLFLTQN